MILTTITLLALTLLGVYIFIENYDYQPLGVIMIIIFGVWLLGHLLCILTVKYDFDMFVIKRDAFEQTLNTSRLNGNDYDTAAIVKDVAEWNVKLARYKFENTTFFYDQYIDDRIDTLKPIQ